jgi:hypothetical protein
MMPVKTQVWEPQMVDQVVRTCYYVPVPRDVVRDVWYCVMVPSVTIDPCSGCPYVTCCPQWVSQQVRCLVYDYRLEERAVNVKVCIWVPRDTVVEHVSYVPEVTQEPSWTVRRYCVMVPYQSVIWVPCWK